MGKDLAAACSKFIKWVRSYQISNLLLDLYHVRNTKLVFFQVSLSKISTEEKQKTLHENNMSVPKEFRSSKPQKQN